MILRVITATFAIADATAVIDGLRNELPQAQSWQGIVSWTHGLRSRAHDVQGLTISIWEDFDAIRRVSEGRTDRDLSKVSGGGLLHDVRVEHFEVVEPVDSSGPVLDGAVLGVIRGMVRPGAEPRVHELIRAVRDEVTAAGVLALHVGRRVINGMTELITVAVWRDRESLHAFAQARTQNVIDPAFTDELTAWRFETYDCISPAQLMLPATGPATLVIDADGRCVDASPAVESLLGIPGVLVLRRPFVDLVAPESRESAEALVAAARPGSAPADATLVLVRPDRAVVTVRAAVCSDTSSPGQSMVRLERIAHPEAVAAD